MPPTLEETYDKIYRYCFFRTQNAPDAEDLTQETFLKALSRFPDLQKAPLPFLYAVARNLCIDRSRRKTAQPLDESAPGREPFGPLETADALGRAVSTLPREQQELLLLRYASGLPIGAMSKITGLSRFAVHRRLSAALKSLREILKEVDFD